MRFVITWLALTLMIGSVPAMAACPSPLLDHPATRLTGTAENLCAAYAGKVVLVVNTASFCGYTPQYEGLQKLYQSRKEAGLVILGFPSEEFGGQEHKNDAEIAKFCRVNYGVTFPMFRKSEVKGSNANPLFRALTQATGEAPSWNFNKYLVSRDGKSVRHFPSSVKPDDAELVRAIDQALGR